MKIGMVLDHVFPPDERVEREAIALVEYGHEVILLCLRSTLTEKARSVYKKINLHKIYIPFWLVKKLRALTNTIFNIYPYLWAYFIKKFINIYNIDALHIHDLYMFSSSLIVRDRFLKNIPLIGDLHENYVEGLKHYRFANSFPGNILISIKRWQAAELKWSQKMDELITVIEEAKSRYESLGILSKKICVVPNYVDPEEFLSQNENPEILKKLKDKFVLVYTGAIDVHRGLEIVIRSIPDTLHQIKTLSLVLVGSGRTLEGLVKLATNLNITENVSFEGWQKRENLLSYIKASDICLVPHLKTVHTDNTIPHKLFQYMLLKKPVIVSDCNPLVRIVEESNCGLVYPSDKPEKLSECISTLYMDQSRRYHLGQNGYQAVMRKYNWKNGQKNLIELYNNLNVKQNS
jgi:glycosyltransferase involved in cell wall biosynthesis